MWEKMMGTRELNKSIKELQKIYEETIDLGDYPYQPTILPGETFEEYNERIKEGGKLYEEVEKARLKGNFYELIRGLYPTELTLFPDESTAEYRERVLTELSKKLDKVKEMLTKYKQTLTMLKGKKLMGK